MKIWFAGRGRSATIARFGLGWFLLLVMSCIGCRRQPEPATSDVVRPVILVSIDTLDAKRLAAFDASAAEHPALDAFARRSFRFLRAYSTASWTLPSHASVFTGLYPVRHGAVARGYRLPEVMPTLAECAGAAGYQTVAFTGGGYLDPTFGLDRGFDSYSAGRPESTHGGPFGPVVDFLRARRDARPLFLFAHTYQVHDYFYATPWASEDTEPFDDPDAEAYLECLRGETDCPAAWWERLSALYAAEIRAVDRAFGDLLTVLDEVGLGDALIVVFSDHGESFRPDDRRIHHGGRLHVDQLHVPLMLAGPDIAPGRSDQPVSLVDLMPTLLDHLDWTCGADAALDGRSLAPLLAGDTLPPRPLFASEFFYDWSEGPRRNLPRFGEPRLESVIAGDRWLIVGDDSVELYDMRRDPTQRNDLAPGDEIPEQMARWLENRGAIDDWQATEEDPELVERLRALGYI